MKEMVTQVDFHLSMNAFLSPELVGPRNWNIFVQQICYLLIAQTYPQLYSHERSTPFALDSVRQQILKCINVELLPLRQNVLLWDM